MLFSNVGSSEIFPAFPECFEAKPETRLDYDTIAPL
jgi:hypothetical protein